MEEVAEPCCQNCSFQEDDCSFDEFREFSSPADQYTAVSKHFQVLHRRQWIDFRLKYTVQLSEMWLLLIFRSNEDQLLVTWMNTSYLREYYLVCLKVTEKKGNRTCQCAMSCMIDCNPTLFLFEQMLQQAPVIWLYLCIFCVFYNTILLPVILEEMGNHLS